MYTHMSFYFSYVIQYFGTKALAFISWLVFCSEVCLCKCSAFALEGQIFLWTLRLIIFTSIYWNEKSMKIICDTVYHSGPSSWLLMTPFLMNIQLNKPSFECLSMSIFEQRHPSHQLRHAENVASLSFHFGRPALYAFTSQRWMRDVT
jgi:hypothetical protein